MPPPPPLLPAARPLLALTVNSQCPPCPSSSPVPIILPGIASQAHSCTMQACARAMLAPASARLQAGGGSSTRMRPARCAAATLRMQAFKVRHGWRCVGAWIERVLGCAPLPEAPRVQLLQPATASELLPPTPRCPPPSASACHAHAARVSHNVVSTCSRACLPPGHAAPPPLNAAPPPAPGGVREGCAGAAAGGGAGAGSSRAGGLPPLPQQDGLCLFHAGT